MTVKSALVELASSKSEYVEAASLKHAILAVSDSAKVALRKQRTKLIEEIKDVDYQINRTRGRADDSLKSRRDALKKKKEALLEKKKKINEQLKRK